MKLRGIQFQPVLDASGARNFDGRGWWYHRPLKPFGLDFSGSTFVAKTTTLHSRKGNLEMQADGISPTKFFPDCVVVRFCSGVALNAVGLSGPGAEALLKMKIWLNWREPFFLSFMTVSSTVKERLRETKDFVDLLQRYQPGFMAPFGLQMNFSCPNVGRVLPQNFLEEVQQSLEIAAVLKVPLMPKLSVTTDVETAVKIASLKECDAICVSNTIPWGGLSNRIDWKNLFGTDRSPLEKYGGGGLSGAPLLPLVEEWVREAVVTRKISKPINAGGGILSCRDVDRLKNCGASSIFIGSVAFLRGWRVKSIIRRAHEVFSE